MASKEAHANHKEAAIMAKKQRKGKQSKMMTDPKWINNRSLMHEDQK